MVASKRIGMAIPTALFMALVVYFLSTVLTWQAQVNQRFTSGEAERAHHSFATRGHVNLFMARVRQSAGYASSHTGRSNAVEASADGFTYFTWCEPVAGNPDVLQIVCETEGKLVPFKSCRSMVKTQDQGMILYTDTGGTTGPPSIRFLRLDEEPIAWADAPPIPQQYYTDAEETDPVTGLPMVDPVTGLPVYNPDPASHVLKTLTPPEQIQTFAAYGSAPNGDLIAIYEPPDIAAAAPPRGYPTLFTFSRSSGSWSVTEIKGGYVPTGLVGQRLGGIDGSLMIRDGDGLLMRDPADPSQFTRVPNPPGGTITTSTASGSQVFAQVSDGSLQVYNGSSWSAMPSPNGDFFSSSGEFTAGSGPVAVSQISVSPNGSITALWQRAGVDTVFRFVPGDEEEPAHWDATLPLTMEDNPDVPYVEDLDSITAMPGRFITQVPGPPQQIYAGRSLLPSPGPNAPVIATGIYILPNGRYYPADFSTY